MRVLPNSLFGRLVLVLLIGLILAQFLSAFVLLRDRGQLLYESVRENVIVRTTVIVRLLDSLEASDRQRLLPVLNTPELGVTLSQTASTLPQAEGPSRVTSEVVKRQLQKRLPSVRQVLVSLEESTPDSSMNRIHRQHMMQGGPMSGAWAFMHGLHTNTGFFNIQVQLKDSTWIRFERNVPQHLFDWPAKLLLVLSLLLVSVILVSLIAVRSIIRPLRNLREAAEGLGKDIKQTPLKESGPIELKETAKAFNTMQQRLQNYIGERARILAAVSHDLKTPLTRLRLRSDLLDDEELRTKTQQDLDDMEAMVGATLDFMRGTETRESSRPLDLMAMLESLKEDALEAGQDVRLQGKSNGPYQGRPLALKRCISNLVDNAVRYGGSARITVKDDKQQIRIAICDQGPGIPEAVKEQIFDPFFVWTNRVRNIPAGQV